MHSLLSLRNARLIDGLGHVSDHQTLLCENGVLRYVGEDRNPPQGYTEIDCSGLTLMPGLIEGHAHISGEASSITVLRKTLQRGITTACSVSANFTGIAMRNAIRAGRARGCADLVAGCVVTPTFGHVRFRDADGPWEVRKAVREMVQAGADFIKTAASGGFWAADESCAVRNYTLEEMCALADEAHAWGRPCVVHAHTQPGINNAVAAGVDQIHHGAFIDEEGVRGILAKDLWFMPTLRVTSDRNIDAWPDRPWMMEEMRQAQPIHRSGVKLAHDLGVKIAFGTDYPGSDFGWCDPPHKIGDSSMFELCELAQAGLSPMEAIVAATRVTAEAYRIQKTVGSLEVGKRADILAVYKDPLEDITRMKDFGNTAFVVSFGNVEYAAGDFTRYYQIADFA